MQSINQVQLLTIGSVDCAPLLQVELEDGRFKQVYIRLATHFIMMSVTSADVEDHEIILIVGKLGY